MSLPFIDRDGFLADLKKALLPAWKNGSVVEAARRAVERIAELEAENARLKKLRCAVDAWGDTVDGTHEEAVAEDRMLNALRDLANAVAEEAKGAGK